MNGKTYPPCAHRTGQTGTGIRQEEFYTPCPSCQVERQGQTKSGRGFALVVVVAVVVVALLIWSRS